MRKEYSSPEMRVEALKVGVYGCYGNDNNDSGGGGVLGNWPGFWNPFFGLCCGGGGG